MTEETPDQEWRRYQKACQMAGTTAEDFMDLCERIAHNAALLKPGPDKIVMEVCMKEELDGTESIS